MVLSGCGGGDLASFMFHSEKVSGEFFFSSMQRLVIEKLETAVHKVACSSCELAARI